MKQSFSGQNSTSSKQASLQQEKDIANLLNGHVTANSGGTRYGGGDVLTDNVLVEAKTTVSPKKSFAVKKEWLTKAKQQAYEQGKRHYALAIRFEQDGEDYFIIDSKHFRFFFSMLNVTDSRKCRKCGSSAYTWVDEYCANCGNKLEDLV